MKIVHVVQVENLLTVKVVMKVCFIILLMEFVLRKKIVQKIITLILKIVNVNNLVSIMMICLVMIAGKDV